MGRVILEIVLWFAAFVAVALLFANQLRVQIREHRFYRVRNWDMSEDSGLDRVDMLSAALAYRVLAPRARFFLFRPLALVGLSNILGFMILKWF